MTMEWNFDSMTAYSEYDGSGIDMAEPISGIDTLSGWSISLGHEAGANNPVPIPGAVWLLGSGLIAMVGIRRGKKG